MAIAAVIFFVTTVICARGWLTRYISTATLFWYLTEKHVPLPTDRDMKEGEMWVVSEIISALTWNRDKY